MREIIKNGVLHSIEVRVQISKTPHFQRFLAQDKSGNPFTGKKLEQVKSEAKKFEDSLFALQRENKLTESAKINAKALSLAGLKLEPPIYRMLLDGCILRCYGTEDRIAHAPYVSVRTGRNERYFICADGYDDMLEQLEKQLNIRCKTTGEKLDPDWAEQAISRKDFTRYMKACAKYLKDSQGLDVKVIRDRMVSRSKTTQKIKTFFTEHVNLNFSHDKHSGVTTPVLVLKLGNSKQGRRWPCTSYESMVKAAQEIMEYAKAEFGVELKTLPAREMMTKAQFKARISEWVSVRKSKGLI